RGRDRRCVARRRDGRERRRGDGRERRRGFWELSPGAAPPSYALLRLSARDDRSDDRHGKRRAAEVGVDRLLREEEEILHVLAAAGNALPAGQRSELDERREEELARALEQDLPARERHADVAEAGRLEPGPGLGDVG